MATGILASPFQGLKTIIMIYDEVHKIRSAILLGIPANSITPCHDDTGHHYDIGGGIIVDSVTTKGSILDKSYLKSWAVKKALEHIRDNWTRMLSSDAEKEKVLLEAEYMHKEILEDASGIGGKIHAVVEDYLNSWITNRAQPNDITTFIPATETDNRLISGVRAAEKYCNENNIIPIHSELLVASRKKKVAGTLDLLAFRGREVKAGNSNCAHELWQVGKERENKYECIHCGMQLKYELALIDWKSSNSIDKAEYMMQTATYWECLNESTKLKPRTISIVQLDKKNGSYDVLEVSLIKRYKASQAYNHLTKTYDWLNSENAEFEKKDKKKLIL